MAGQIPTWLGITCLLLLAGLAIFAVVGFRKGLQVRRPPEGVPPERFNF
jgi:hypothetical protein